MNKELSSVVLTTDLPELGLVNGDVSTVVLVHCVAGYEVEFLTADGHTFAITSLSADQIRPAGRHEVTHARPVVTLNQESGRPLMRILFGL